MPSKILVIPPMPWYMEAHVEYLIRHLSDEFILDQAFVPYPPYENFLNRFPEDAAVSPFMRNPDDYDLIWPILPTHWGVTDKDKYAHKVATVFYQPNEGRFEDVAVVGSTTPLAETSLKDHPHFNLRFGVDTELFKPFKMVREDHLLHVGMVGNLFNPRRMVKEVIETIGNLEGVRLMLFLGKAPVTDHDMDFIGGRQNLKYIVSGDKQWPGVPNLYNQLDVLIRCESDPGYSFPVLEAAACGIPIIATDSGIDHFITKEGGILIPGNREFYLNQTAETMAMVKEAVIFMRDHPNHRHMMGLKGRKEILRHWTWDKFIPEWRKFFREGVKKAQ